MPKNKKRPAPKPLEFTPRAGVDALEVEVARMGDDVITVNANGLADELIAFLEDVDELGDLVASHKYLRHVLGDDQYELVRTWGLTSAEWAHLGAHCINVATGSAFGMGDHLRQIEQALVLPGLDENGDQVEDDEAG